MDLTKIIETLSYTFPSIIVGVVAYLFFRKYTKTEEIKLKISLQKVSKKDSLPIKLQAYERMTLYLERINPSKLIIRVTSINNDKGAYALSLINTLEQEFEHNLTQQIYISAKCWNVIIASKNATIQLIQQTSSETKVTNAQELRETILQKMVKGNAPSNTALAFIKDEVHNIL